MRYQYAKYGYYIPGSEFTVKTYCPSCQVDSVMTVLGDGAIQLQCSRCDYNARYDSYESLRRCSRSRERIARMDLNQYCERMFEVASVVFQSYTRQRMQKQYNAHSQQSRMMQSVHSSKQTLKRTLGTSIIANARGT